MHWLLDPIQKHYADFEGRIGRQEFWMYVLFVFGINVVLSAVHLDMFSMLIGLGLLVPNLAMGARRLHDTGRTGWLQLLGLIPIIGWIILIIWLAEETKPVDNEYGKPAEPKVVNGMASTAPVSNPEADIASTSAVPEESTTPATSEQHS